MSCQVREQGQHDGKIGLVAINASLAWVRRVIFDVTDQSVICGWSKAKDYGQVDSGVARSYGQLAVNRAGARTEVREVRGLRLGQGGNRSKDRIAAWPNLWTRLLTVRAARLRSDRRQPRGGGSSSWQSMPWLTKQEVCVFVLIQISGADTGNELCSQAWS